MQAGKLRETILLQRKQTSRDAIGAEVITWVDVRDLPAEADPLSGREYVSMRQAQSDLTTRFRIRYRQGVNANMRVIWRDETYRIAEVINVGARNRTLELMCIAESPNA